MERKIRLIIEGQDRASGVINGVASNTNKAMAQVEGATKRGSNGAMTFLKSFLAWQAIHGVINGVQSVVSGVINAVGAAISDTAQKGAAFEQTMSAIEAVTQATGQELDDLRLTALRLGKDTIYTSSEAAKAIEELAKAGVSAADIVGGAADAAVSLASAGSLELEEAASVMAKAMNTFKLSADDADFASDVLVGAANASATSVHNIGEAIKYAGPMMQALTNDTYTSKAAMVDFATAVAMASQSGIDAGMAGAGWQRFLEGLTPNSEKAAAMMEKLGIVTEETGNRFFDAQGDFIGAKGALDVLHGAVVGLSDQEAVEAFETMFGQRAGRVIQAIINSAYDAEKGWDHYRGAIIDAGVASDTATIKLNNLAGAWEYMKGSLEFIQLSAWTKDIETSLTPAVNRVSQLFNDLGTAIQRPEIQAALNNFAKVISQTVVHAIDVFQPKMEGFVAAFGKPETTRAFQDLGLAVQNLISAFAGEAKPMDPNNGIFQIRGFTDYMGSDVPRTASANTVTLSGAIGILADAINGFAEAWRKYRDFDKEFKAWQEDLFNPKGNLITQDLPNNRIQNLLDSIAASIDDFVTNVIGGFPARLDAAWDLVAWSFQRTGERIRSKIAGWLDPARLAIDDFGMGLYTQIGATWAIFDSSLDVIVRGTADVIAKAVLSWLPGILLSLTTMITDITTTITGWGTTIAETITGMDWSSEAAAAASTVITGLVTGLLSTDAIASVVGAAATVGRAAIDAVKSVFDSHSPSRVMIDVGQDVIQGLIDGFSNMQDSAIQKVRDIAGMLRDAFGLIQEAIPALDSLVTFRAGRIERSTVEGFANDVFGVVETLQAVVLKFSKDGVKLAAEWATSAGTIIGIITSGIEALTALRFYRAGLTRDMVVQFVQDAVGFVQTFEVLVRDFVGEGVTRASEWATAAGTILGIVTDGIDALTSLRDHKPGLVRQTVIDFSNDVAYVVEQLRIISERWTDEAIARAATISDGIGRILAPIVGAVEAFTSLKTHKGIMPWMIDMLGADIRLVVDKMVDMARKFDVDGVEAAAKFADAVNRIIAPVKTAVETFTSVRDYKGLAVDAFRLLANDMTGVIGHLTAMWRTMDQEGVAAAAGVAESANTIFGSMKEGMDAIASINDGKPLDAGKANQFFADIQGVLATGVTIAKAYGADGGFSIVQGWQDKMLELQPGFQAFISSYFTDAGKAGSASMVDGLNLNLDQFRSAGRAAGEAYSDGFNSALNLNTQGRGNSGGDNNDREYWTRSNNGGGNITVNGLALPEAVERIRQSSIQMNKKNTNMKKVYGVG